VGSRVEPLALNDPPQIGPYRLFYRLGSGGMGRVYLGMSPGGRAVAVKVIHPHLADDPLFVFYFRREVESAQAVGGAYTASVIASGLSDVPPWLATVYVPGPSLAQTVLERGPLPEIAVWRLAGGLVEALQAVHACKLVHRDLKPANVLLALDGPKVIDFGISRALEEVFTTLGRPSPAGTPAFMSPEQADGRTAGPESDVFSLGSVIAFAATGTVLFKAALPAAEIYRVINDQPDLTNIAEPLRDLVRRCLHKDPECRPGLDDLLAAVEAGSAAYAAPTPSSFWPEPLAVFIRSRQDLTDPPATPGLHQPQPVPAEPVIASAPPAHLSLPDPAEPILSGAISENEADRVRNTPPPHADAPPSPPVRPDRPDRPDQRATAERPRRSRARLLIAGGAVLAAAAATGLVWVLDPGAPPSKAATAVSYDPPAVHYPDGLVIKTHWSLSGTEGSSLFEQIIATDATGAALAVQFQEPVPTAILPAMGAASFEPSAPMIIDHGTGLVWALRVPASGEDVVGYRVAVTAAGVSKARLMGLVRRLSPVRRGPVTMPAPPVRLQSVTIMPGTLRLASGRSERLRLVGLLSNGKRAPAAYLSKVIWSTGNRRFAKVNAFGKVTAVNAGMTKITARVGNITTFITVIVTTLPVPSPGSSYTAPYTPPYTAPGSSSSVPTSTPTATLTPPPI
jgi:serine/threonine protein kinase